MRFRREVAEAQSRAGFTRGAVNCIPPEMTFRQWCERLGEAGLKVDGMPFSLENRRAMHFVYDQIPTTPEEAVGKTVVLMKCSQVGFTVAELLAVIYMALKFEPMKIGLYLPDMKLAAAKSSERFMPIMRTIPDAYNRLTVEADTGKQKGGEGNVMIRAMGSSRFHFLWTTGRATTESFPMDCISFDEVQEMRIADMEKTRERLSASKIKFTLMGSTAHWPDADIHFWYKKGTQHQFHTRCPHCGESCVLDEYFPDCIKFDVDLDDYAYVCRHCQGWIDDPQIGEWVAKVPDARFISIHFPQMLSPTITPREIIEAYFNADDMQNFYNRKLGKPWTDPSQVPVDLAMLNQCAADGMAAGVVWKERATGTFMGLDQMGAFNVAIVKERLADGRQAVIHLEYIYDADPFARCSALMDQYGVQCCVVETLPNYNDAKRFSQRHPGRVFLAGYTDMAEGMLRWGDAPSDRSDRRTTDEARDRHTVTLDQYKCMQVAMQRIAKRICLFPDPDALEQDIIDKGVRVRKKPLKDVAFLHFTRTALVTEKVKSKEDEKKLRRAVKKVGIDPHTSYANMLCDVAWSRAYGTGLIIMPNMGKSEPQSPLAQRVAEQMPGLPQHVVAMMDDLPAGVCGSCTAFLDGRCTERDLQVGPRDPSCVLYEARPR